MTQPEAEERERAEAADESSRPQKFFPRDESLVEEYRRFQAEHPDMSQAEIAAAAKLSDSKLSQYFNKEGNKYTGDSAGVARRMREFFRDQRTLLDTGIPTIESEITRKISDALEDTRTCRGLGVIIGPPGIGKTRGIELYCAEHELAIPFSAWSGECNRAATERLLFEAAAATRIKSGNKARLLVDKLRGSGRLIIVDDAHKLTRPALQLLFDFRDRTSMPIALFGDDRLLVKLSDDGQRLRRSGGVFYLKVKTVKNGDKRDPVPDARLIDHHIASILPDEARSEAAPIRALCAQIAARSGHYGSVQMELARAVRLHKGNPEWSWCEAIRKAHKRLIRDYDLV